MATQPPSDSTNSTDEKSQISEVMQPTTEVQQDVPEASNQISPKSVFVNSEPIREEQVQNAIKFLSHPRVRGSPVIHRRSFLERKGLTKEEIDEAFRRVPDPPPSTQTTAISQEGQTTSSGVQPQIHAQILQPIAASPAGVQPSRGILSKRQFHWYHAVIAVGVLAASGAGTAILIKNSLVPRIKSWVRRVVLEEEETEPSKRANGKPTPTEEAAAAAKAAATAAADVAKASQEMMMSRIEDKKYFEEFIRLLDVQVQEMKSMSNNIRKLEGKTQKQDSYMVNQEDYEGSFANSRRPYSNGKADNDFRSVSPLPSPAPVEPSMPPHPKSYMDIMQMVQRGEKPSNIREINDLPPNPNQQPSNPRMALRAKPWESASNNGLNHQSHTESSAPWWQRKIPGITETENVSPPLMGTGQSQTKEQPQIQKRSWVPPLPPPVYMPEAAEAIRRPKRAVMIDQQDDVDDDETISNKSGATIEPQRIEAEINDGGKDLQNNEIEEVQE